MTVRLRITTVNVQTEEADSCPPGGDAETANYIRAKQIWWFAKKSCMLLADRNFTSYSTAPDAHLLT